MNLPKQHISFYPYLLIHLLRFLACQRPSVFGFCIFTAISLRILLSHFNQVHSDEEFQIICGLGDTPACHKIFSKYNSFYRHVKRKHDDIYRGCSDPPSDGQYLIVPTKEDSEVEPQQSCDF